MMKFMCKFVRGMSAVLVVTAVASGVPSGGAENADREKKVHERAKATGTIRLEVVDAVGQRFTPKYVVVGAGGKTVSAHDEAKPAAEVAPGTYTVKPSFDESLGKQVSVKRGENVVATVKADKHILLTFASYDYKKEQRSYTRLPLKFKDRIAMRSALADIVGLADIYTDHFATRRAGVTREQLDHAMNLVRREVPDLFKRHARGVLHQDFREVLRWNYAYYWPTRIIAIAGERSDAERLVDLITKQEIPRYPTGGKLMSLVAHVENRLGILDKGALAAALKGKSRTIASQAAALLHKYGVSAGDETLNTDLRGRKDAFDVSAATTAAYVLLDTDSQAVLEAMRATVQRYADEKKRIEAEHRGKKGLPRQPFLWSAAVPAAMYLLAYGDEADRRLAAPVEFRGDERQIQLLANVLEDPRPLVDYILGLKLADKRFEHCAETIASLYSSVRKLPPQAAAQFDQYAKAALIRLAQEKNISQIGPKEDAMVALWHFDVQRSRFWANKTTAWFTFDKNDKRLPGADWIPQPWREGKNVGYKQLEYIPHDKLKKIFEEEQRGKFFLYPELFLAYHEIGTTACEPRSCAFVLCHRGEPAGALSVVVDVLPEFVEGKLRIGLRFDLADYLKGGFIFQTEKNFKPFIQSRGKALVHKIYLERGEEVVPLTEAGVKGRGTLVYEAVLKERDFNDLYLHVQLKFFDQTWPLDFALFAGDYARSYRRAAARVAGAEEACKTRPKDDEAWIDWGNALITTGHVKAAQEKYEKARRLKPDSVEAYFGLGLAYAKLGSRKKALAVQNWLKSRRPGLAEKLVVEIPAAK